MHGLIHKRLAERKASESAESPHGFWIRLLEKITVVAGVIGPLMTIPQIWDIYYLHHAAGVSVISWFAFGTLDIPFLLYGLVHRDRPIVITYALWFAANFAVAIGAFIYR